MGSIGLAAELRIPAVTLLPPAGGALWKALAAESELTPGREAEQDSAPHCLDKRLQRSASKPNLLLVEDNAADVLLVEHAIELHSVPVDLHIVVDGEEAIAFIERAERDPQAPCPDMVLLDLNLPRKSGTEVLQRVRRSDRCKHVPVIILTSSDAPKDRAATSNFGANRYFRKPTDYDEYMKVGKVLNEIVDELEGKK